MWPRGLARTLLGVCWLAAVACSSPPPSVTWSVRFDAAPRARAAAFVRARIRRGACGSGEIVRDYGRIGRDASVEMPGAMLPPGSYCFEAEAIDRGCVRYAVASRALDVPGPREVELVLSVTTASRECAELSCRDGTCDLAIDAGVDAGTDAGFAWPDTNPPDGGPPPPLTSTGCGVSEVLGFEGAVRAGGTHTCALTHVAETGRALSCWGADDHGQLGVGGVGESRVPRRVSGSYTRIALGLEHTCALDAAGTLFCWGRNDRGQLGVGDTEDRQTPTRVLDSVSVMATGGEHTCAIRARMESMATVFDTLCWGANDRGQLGAAGPDRNVPTVVPLPTTMGFAPPALVAGAAHTCIALGDEMTFTTTNWCWGEPGPWLGRARGDSAPSPIDAEPTFSSALTAGGQVTCDSAYDVMAMTLATRCWGRGLDGRLLDGSSADSFVPVVSLGGMGASPGGSFTCQVRPTPEGSSGVYCAGDRATGVLGPMPPAGLAPTLVLAGASALAAGDRHACAVTPGGLTCWGANERGQLGTGGARDVEPTPARVCF